MNDREQAETAISNLLLQRIRNDRYPSATEMQLLEQILPKALTRDYLNVLLEKVVSEKYPSTPMLQRIIRVVESM